jgi:hypothetical protein
MEKYYISSNKYSLQERQTKRGKVYDVLFRIVTMDGVEKLKRLSGFSTKSLAKQGYIDFVTTYCELVKNNPLKKKNTAKEKSLAVFVFSLLKLQRRAQTLFVSIIKIMSAYSEGVGSVF